MSRTSEFFAECDCGAPLKSADKTGLCPECRISYRLDWPARYGEAIQAGASGAQKTEAWRNK